MTIIGIAGDRIDMSLNIFRAANFTQMMWPHAEFMGCAAALLSIVSNFQTTFERGTNERKKDIFSTPQIYRWLYARVQLSSQSKCVIIN